MAKSSKKKGPVREYVEAIVVALAIALSLRFFVVEAFKIPSGSMIQTLLVGDFIFVNKLSYRSEVPYAFFGVKFPMGGTTLAEWDTPERGDIVVFRWPIEQKIDYIKRIVGLPGDTIELVRNELIVNGKRYDRQFVRTIEFQDQTCSSTKAQVYREDDGTQQYDVLVTPNVDAYESYGPVTVPEGHVFAMGDNRDNSSDSRAWGFVPIEYVKGRALFVWLSVDSCGGWLDRIRWSRFGKAVK